MRLSAPAPWAGLPIPRAPHARALLVTAGLMLGLVLSLLPAPPSAVASPVTHPVVVSANPADWTPQVLDGRVYSIVQAENRVIVGGSFTQVREHGTTKVLARSGLFAFDATTGAIDPSFHPALNGPVNALQVSANGSSVYVGGGFTTVNGKPAQRLTRLRIANGYRVRSFRPPRFDAEVNDLRLSRGRLFVGGRFAKVGRRSHAALVALRAGTGAYDPSVKLTFSGARDNGTLLVRKMDMTQDGRRLIALGNFTRVDGRLRPQLVVVRVSPAGAHVSRWATTFFRPGCPAKYHTYMHDLDIAPNGRYFVVSTTGGWRRGSPCDLTARFELNVDAPGQLPTWRDYPGGDTTWAVEITGPTVYVGGHFQFQNDPFTDRDVAGPGSVPREGIAALDPVNGLPFSWNPGRTRGVGVFDMLATTQGLWVGSDTRYLGGEYHARLGFFPLAGGSPIPAVNPHALPANVYRAVRRGDRLLSTPYDGATAGTTRVVPSGIRWRAARGAFLLNDTLYTGWANGRLYARSFDGTSIGPKRRINLHGLNFFGKELKRVTGMFYDRGRLYYTLRNRKQLFSRYFTMESEVVGAQRFVAARSRHGVRWDHVAGMFRSRGHLYVAVARSGRLLRVGWRHGHLAGRAAVVSAPRRDGHRWASKAMFIGH